MCVSRIQTVRERKGDTYGISKSGSWVSFHFCAHIKRQSSEGRFVLGVGRDDSILD